MKRILVAGIGNVFKNDDAFGVEVAKRLMTRAPPARVADFGVRGVHLAYELLEPLDLLLVADATARGGAPGTLYVIEPELGQEAESGDPHGMQLASVFSMLRALGGAPPRVLIVGCEPEDVDDGMALSPRVERAIEPAVELVLQILEREQGDQDEA